MSIDLTTIFQVMPYAQNVAHADLVHPGASLVAAQAQAQQTLAEQSKQTQPIEQQEETDAVKDEKQRDKSQHQRQSRGKHQARPEDQETQASNSTPFAGHILNMKV